MPHKHHRLNCAMYQLTTRAARSLLPTTMALLDGRFQGKDLCISVNLPGVTVLDEARSNLQWRSATGYRHASSSCGCSTPLE